MFLSVFLKKKFSEKFFENFFCLPRPLARAISPQKRAKNGPKTPKKRNLDIFLARQVNFYLSIYSFVRFLGTPDRFMTLRTLEKHFLATFAPPPPLPQLTGRERGGGTIFRKKMKNFFCLKTLFMRF